MLLKITVAVALAMAALTVGPASVGPAFACAWAQCY
jgi:hypothetical protein